MLAVAGERLRVPNAFGRGVAVLDRRTGARLQSLATGRSLLGVTLATGDPE